MIAALLATPITDTEIEAATLSLRLPDRAFHGADGGDPRLDVLRSNRSIDVAACPGSGKTTLLIAKLAILGRRWTSASQGICVLSHTNVARREIETRLGADSAGRMILSYPHFVGTIHGFVNQFIALPWLRSLGINLTAIDTDICIHRRWGNLALRWRKAIKNSSQNAKLLQIKSADHDLGDIRWGKHLLGKQTEAYKAFVEACHQATNDGFFCFDDMMIWARQALDRCPELLQSTRRRFPILFLDEVQDNSEVQSSILHRIFIEGPGAVARQRFGDMNQAIYDHADELSGAKSDPFPNPAISILVPNSHRFGQQIATAANPLALSPPGLVGLREGADEDGGTQTALLLFDAASPNALLPAFAKLLITRFSATQRLQGTFAAVGAIHRNTERDDPPNCVAHYWADYDHQLARTEGKPDKLIGYLRRGITEFASNGDLRPIVERTADGLLRLASLLKPTVRHPYLANRHRQLISLLYADPVTCERYQKLCWRLATGGLAASAPQWERWKRPLLDIGGVLVGGAAPSDIELDGFLEWEDERGAGDPATRHGNILAYPATAPAVRVKVGSIHSVKGETHLATLVLDTHYHGSHLSRIKDWLTGTKVGLAPGRGNARLRTSLKQHYVAVTRPSHLLCIAMRRDCLTDAELALMSDRNWAVGEIVGETISWRG